MGLRTGAGGRAGVAGHLLTGGLTWAGGEASPGFQGGLPQGFPTLEPHLGQEEGSWPDGPWSRGGPC